MCTNKIEVNTNTGSLALFSTRTQLHMTRHVHKRRIHKHMSTYKLKCNYYNYSWRKIIIILQYLLPPNSAYSPPPRGLLCKINTKNKFRNPTIFTQFTQIVTCNFAERNLRLTVDKTARRAIYENQCKYHYATRKPTKMTLLWHPSKASSFVEFLQRCLS